MSNKSTKFTHMQNQEIQIYQPAKRDFLSWSNLIWTIATGIVAALIAIGTAWGTVVYSQRETKLELDNFQKWAYEQKIERNEKIASEKAERIESDNAIKNSTVSKDELKGTNDKLDLILKEVTYVRGRIDDLEIRKQNN